MLYPGDQPGHGPTCADAATDHDKCEQHANAYENTGRNRGPASAERHDHLLNGNTLFCSADYTLEKSNLHALIYKYFYDWNSSAGAPIRLHAH